MYLYCMDAILATTDSVKRRGKGETSGFFSVGPIQERAIHTRQELLESARLVFARDGFEKTRLQDIAEAAGKTRGALYAHFKDKEDLFFALIEEDIMLDDAVYESKLGPTSSHEQQISVLTAQLEALVHDRQRALLYVEFKLYAARRPHKQHRLAELHAAMCNRGATRKVQLLPSLAISDPVERRHVFASFAALIDGLVLNHYFDALGLTDEEIHAKIERAVREQVEMRL